MFSRARFVSSFLGAPRRALNVHEWQGKEILRSFGVTTQKGGAGTTAKQVEEIAKGLKGELVVKVIFFFFFFFLMRYFIFFFFFFFFSPCLKMCVMVVGE